MGVTGKRKNSPVDDASIFLPTRKTRYSIYFVNLPLELKNCSIHFVKWVANKLSGFFLNLLQSLEI